MVTKMAELRTNDSLSLLGIDGYAMLLTELHSFTGQASESI